MNTLNNLIGKEVTAIGDCGMKKDQVVIGILETATQNETIIYDGRYMCSVNPNTVKAVLRKFKTSYVNGRINVQVLTSVDNGATFNYCGVGRYCGDLVEAKNYLKRFA